MTSSQQGAAGHKPRLLFFRWTREGLAPFVHDQLAEQLRGLSLFFDVTLVDHDGDFDALCDQHRPDLVLFESGVYVGPRQLTNLHTHQDIPRAGFLNADAFDPVRAVFLADMAAWGVGTYFTVSASMASYTPEIVDQLFCWPNWVDPTIHRDHGLPKVVPILLTGSQARHYPWRNRVNTVLAQHYPVLSTPHFGWLDSAGARTMLVGEAYSRMISSASFAPSCGNFTQDFVRKHLEIPASGTCLIAQRTPATEAAGFVDMANCVLADEDDVLDKASHLFAHPDELAAVTDAGRRLVLERHTAERRSQIHDWFELTSAGVSAIVQDDPFAPLRAAAGADGTERTGLLHVAPSTAEDRVYLRAGWAAVAGGRLGAAERAFTGAASFQALPEAVIGSATAQLLDGRAEDARATVQELMSRMDRLYQPPTPDPVQWAVHVWTLLCCGELAQAAAAAGTHPELDHLELRRTRSLVAALTTYDAPASPGPTVSRASANPLPAVSWDQWLRRISAMLRTNGQADAAAAALSLLGSTEPAAGGTVGDGVGDGAVPERGPRPSAAPTTARSRSVALPRAVAGRGAARARTLLGRGSEHLREQARTWVGQTWLDAIAECVERESLDTVLVVGPSRLSLRERSLRLAAARNPRVPRVVDVAADGSDLDTADRGRCLLHLGRRAVVTDHVVALAATSRVVVLEDALRPQVTRLADRLVDGGEFELIALSRSRGGGYYVFRHRLGQGHAPPPGHQDSEDGDRPDPQSVGPEHDHLHPQRHRLVTHGEPA